MGGGKTKYVIVEHLEPCISPWMLSEYSYLSTLFPGRTIFTNVKNVKHYETLKQYGKVFEETFTEVVRALNLTNTIILDPKAEKTLIKEELQNADAVVVGGIMGDHPPKGRTEKLITSKAKHMEARNLGEGQLTIAGVAYVLKELEGGKELKDLDIREGLEISIQVGDYTVTVELPYAFPYKDGEPVLPHNYADVVVRKALIYEENPCTDQ